MSASRARVELWMPRRICLSVSSAKKRSTWLIQEAEVGVKWMCQRGRLANQSRMSLVLWLPALSMTRWMSRSVHVALDGVEEAAELPGAMAGEALADDLADLHVERGEQRERAMPLVVVGAALGLAGPHRQERLGAVQRLDLALLVDAKHHRAIRRVEIEPDDVAHLLHEQRVGGELEGLGSMRLHPKALQMRWMVEGAWPTAAAMERRLQCVAPGGRVSSYLLAALTKTRR